MLLFSVIEQMAGCIVKGFGKQLMGFGTPSPSISPASLPAQSLAALG